VDVAVLTQAFVTFVSSVIVVREFTGPFHIVGIVDAVFVVQGSILRNPVSAETVFTGQI
jgi:hypothetical protein